ncbi:MAG TPA: peptidoglycan-associated lipoprotein Pal [Xylella taiwanensis]
MNNSTRFLLVSLLSTSALVACSKKVKEQPHVPVKPVTPPVSTPMTPPTPTHFSGLYTVADLDTDACLRQRVVYFEFDKDDVKQEFQTVMACHAKYLQNRPSARITLQGNTDERGSREYNVALGERRAKSVSYALQANGASSGQLNVVSYGEERPVCTETTESCWSRNRRVEIVYTAK